MSETKSIGVLKKRGGTSKDAVRIATFDSGFGGYFTAQAIWERIPALQEELNTNIRIDHFGDTANAPYGARSDQQIADLTIAGISDIIEHEAPELIFIACNTASTQYDKIIEEIKAKYPEYEGEIVPIIQPTVELIYKQVLSPALEGDTDLHFGIYATPATIKSTSYQRKIASQLGVSEDMIEFGPITEVTTPPSAKESIQSTAIIPLQDERKLHIHLIGPGDWVGLVENEDSPVLQLQALEAKAGKSYVEVMLEMLPEGATLCGIGEFCTHYPVFDGHIQAEAFRTGATADNAMFITQANIMANLFETKMRERMEQGRFAEAEEIENPAPPSIHISGDNIVATQRVARSIFAENAGNVEKWASLSKVAEEVKDIQIKH